VAPYGVKAAPGIVLASAAAARQYMGGRPIMPLYPVRKWEVEAISVIQGGGRR
jgi:hypothetical protein